MGLCVPLLCELHLLCSSLAALALKKIAFPMEFMNIYIYNIYKIGNWGGEKPLLIGVITPFLCSLVPGKKHATKAGLKKKKRSRPPVLTFGKGRTVGFWCLTSTRSVKYCLSNAGFGVVEFIGPIGILQWNICFSPPDSDFFLVKRKRIQTGTLGPPLFGTRKKTMMTHGQLELPAPNIELSDFLGSFFLRCGGSGVAEVTTRLPWALPPKMILKKLRYVKSQMPFPDSNPRKYWLNLASRNSVTC